ncbi:hypothetical protein LWI28_028428 [Acer negundo]|uniref:Uncharacterized protein n=1 Tax=Acer negundo TaxID=4023 RepID=A0AAD5P0J7_ACENE|nr:hypothetical protein LWI28_028428 [Acer negundo]
MVRAKENRRGVMLQPQPVEGSTMVSTGGNNNTTLKQSRPINDNGRNDVPKPSNRDTVWCTYFLAYLNLDDSNDLDGRLLNLVDKVPIGLEPPSMTLPEVDVDVPVCGIVMGQIGATSIRKPNVISPRATLEMVVPTVQGSITQVEGIARTQGTLMATAAVSLGAFPISFVELNQPNPQSQN